MVGVRQFIWFALAMLPVSLMVEPTVAQTFDWRGQVSGWLTVNDGNSPNKQLGVRYIPEFSGNWSAGDEWRFDVNIAFNGYARADFGKLDDADTDGELDAYRLWVRASSSQLELRLGLQKINFGSATLLRPLMWFDRIDPRDPLQLTDGVYGFLARYYNVNNANVWFWVLLGNDDPKGREVFGSVEDEPEYGGRVQLPVPSGELALSYHHRSFQVSVGPMIDMPEFLLTVGEDRFALDGKWDVVVGAWFETDFTHYDNRFLPYSWQRAVNVGIDYTFGVGNGITATTEYFGVRLADGFWSNGDGVDMSALSLMYPWDLVNNVSTVVYYNWDSEDWYRLVDWQQLYDNWNIHVIGYWNPDQYSITELTTGAGAYSGTGLQLLLVYNH